MINIARVQTELRKHTLAKGAALFGVADLHRIRSDTGLLDSRYDVYTRGISIGADLRASSLVGVIDGPSRLYVNEYLRVNRLLDAIAGEVKTKITAEGFRAEPIPASEVVDWEKLRGHLSHKLIGRYAGHGWIGRNILLVNPEYGSRVRYVTVLTDLPLEAGSPVDAGCEACVRCLSVCPAGSIKKESAKFDLKACFDQLQRFNEMLGEPHFICGLCVSVCKGRTKNTKANCGRTRA